MSGSAPHLGGGAHDAIQEKTFAAERYASRVRVFLIAAVSVWLAMIWDPAEGGADPRVVSAVLALAWVYVPVLYFWEPYRRFPILLSATFIAVSDALLIAFFILGTGGFESPWYPLMYIGIASMSFRFGGRETVLAAISYGGAHVVTLAALGELAPNLPAVFLRCAFLFFAAALTGPHARETLAQTRARIAMETFAHQADAAAVTLRGMLRSAPTAMVMADAAGNVELVNDRAAELLAAEPRSLLAQPREKLLARFEPYGIADRAWKTLRMGGSAAEVAVRHSGGHEGTRDLLLRLSAIGRRDDPRGAIAVIVDVTDRKRAEKELLTARLRAEEAERRRIAIELHDEVGQILTGMSLALDAAARQTGDAWRAGVEEARQLVDRIMTRVQDLSLDLRPPVLDDLGLLPALARLFERYTSQTRINVEFKQTGLGGRFPAEVETAAYRLVQEALTNVARHAKVDRVAVRGWTSGSVLNLQIEDRGKGFEPAPSLYYGSSSGLAGMRERASLVGGTVAIESSPGTGTRIHAELPLGFHTEESST